jgi:hypothetical protein
MTRKTDSPNTRRNHFLYRASKSEAEIPITTLAASVGMEPAAVEIAKAEFSKSALRLDMNAQDISSKAVRKAFETFKLDPADPFHWRLLIDRLAYIQFGERPKKARKDPKKWTSSRKALLRSEIKPLGKLSNKKAAVRLVKDKKSAFFEFGVAGLEKKIEEIRRTE